MNISPEVDEMMWNIANTGDFQAVENFKKQYPDFHNELSRRVLLVKDLKRAKTLQVAAVPRPPFVPRPKIRRYYSWPMVGGILAAAAAISAAMVYSVDLSGTPVGAIYFKGEIPVNGPLKNGFRIRAAAAAKSRSLVINSTSLPNAGSVATKPETVPKEAPRVKSAPLLPNPSEFLDKSDGPIPATVSDGSRPTKVSSSDPSETHILFKETPLAEVVKAIGSTYKIEIKTAPGLSSPSIDVDERTSNPRDLLEQLGHKYGFAIVDEGKAGLLLVPTTSTGSNDTNP